MSPELLPTTEALPEISHTEAATNHTRLSDLEVTQLFSARKKKLEPLKNLLSLKFYYAVAEKIHGEELQFRKLLHIEHERRENNSQFSFILDSQYFEQKLFSGA